MIIKNIPLAAKRSNFAIKYFDKALQIVNTQPTEAIVKMTGYALTGGGRQLFNLGHFDPDYTFLQEVGLKIKEQGFLVYIGDIVFSDGIKIVQRNMQEL